MVRIIEETEDYLLCLNDKQQKTFKISPEDRYCLSTSWFVDIDGYVKGRVNGQHWRLHRYLVRDKLSKGLVVDHRNRDKSDCTQENLKICTQRENQRNQKVVDNLEYIGVYKKTNQNGWIARVKYPEGFKVFYMKTKRRAAILFDAAMFQMRGTLSATNLELGKLLFSEVEEEFGTRNLNEIKIQSDFRNSVSGVQKKKDRFLAFLTINGKYSYIGTFKTEYEAILAREKKIIEHHSNSASNLDFLKKEDRIALYGKDIVEADH